MRLATHHYRAVYTTTRIFNPLILHGHIIILLVIALAQVEVCITITLPLATIRSSVSWLYRELSTDNLGSTSQPEA